MAIDQNSVPKDPLPLNLYPSRPSAPFQLSCYNAAKSPAADKLADDQPAARKVKLLCSFGGKILPRPSDGAFRYAGGQTRIIAVRRDITIYEFYRKMADAYGAPVAIRYQLPDEDLDALVSVSSAEDLDNMMEEYDKLTEVSGDGSAKLRVFLFSQAELASVLSDNYFAGPALIYTFDGGQVYVEAVNGVSVSDDGIYSSEIRPKESMASPSSTQNSDAGFNGSYNEGSPPGFVSPITGVSASFDPSILPFAGTAASVPLHEAQGFPANSTVFGQAMVAAQSLNPPNLAPYASQAFVESHQVPYMPPHSLNMATDGMMNVVSAPQHTYLPSMLPIPPSSMPAPVGTAKPIQGKRDPFLEEDQLSGRFVNPLPDHNYKVFQQTLSQKPPLQPSHPPPPSIEPYGLHLVPPLAQGPVLRFENWRSDRLVNELSNVSGVHVPNDHPIVHSNHSEDIARLQGQHRVVSVAMIESSMEPKVEPTVNPDQCGTYGANNVPDSVLDMERIFGSTFEKIDHSNLRQPLGALGLSGDTQAPYGVFVSSPQSHFESYFQQQQKQVLNGDYFHAAKVLHPTAAFTLPSSVHPYNGASLSPPQTPLDGSLQQHNVLLAESADYIQVLHPTGTLGLSSTGQTTYGVSVEPLQPHHDASLHLKRLLAGTPPPFFPDKQTVIGKQCSKDSSSINNISHNVPEHLSQCQYNAKQVDGLMEALNLCTIDSLRFGDQLKPKLVPNFGVPKDMKPENLTAVGDDNAFRLQNGSNAPLSSNAFITSVVGPEGIYINPVNPAALSTGFSRVFRPESSSVVGVDNNTLRPQCEGSKLPSSEAFINTGLLSKENFMGPINPLLSTMMEVHTSELANTCQASTIARSSALHTQRVKPLQSSQLLPGVSPYISDYAYTNTIAEGTSRVRKDEVCQVQNMSDYLAASQRGNAPFPFSSSIVPGQGGQFQDNFDPCSLLNNEVPQEILGSMNAYLPRPAIVATRKPIISGDTSNENRLPKGQSHDVAILLEEGALHPPLDWLLKESRLDPVIDYIDQDLRDIAEQVGESALQSSPPVSLLPFSRPEEMRPPFLCSHTPSDNRLPKGQSPDIAALLEEGALRSPLDWLINESRPDPIIGAGPDYIDQDLHDLAEQVAESVLQSSIPPLSVLSFSGPKEISHPFLRVSGLSEDNCTSQSADDLVDQRIEDKPGQSDKLHMGLVMANYFGRLQIIKNSDLEELRELGSGTFGTVYHGKWRGSDVAIKRINDRCFTGKPSEQERMRADFWNEANKLADLHHPNVVTFYGIVIDGPSESLATVTEYMVNGSLRNALQRDDKTLDRWKCLLIAMDVAFGMEYLHGKNIVHFDLKSDNLLVNLRDHQRPICKIGDLGLSKIKCETLVSGGVRGTLPWMAPELLNGCSNMASEKVDVFSFGIVMWELLTGEEPYSDLHCGAIIGGILTNTLRPTVPDSCDPEWGSLMEQCWSTDPIERPSFTEIAERLRSMAASFPQKGQAQT